MKDECTLKEFNLIVTGVGGQGSVLASHIVAEAAVANNLKTRVGTLMWMAPLMMQLLTENL